MSRVGVLVVVLAGVLVAGCRWDLVSGHRFSCSGPEDRSCGAGQQCVLAGGEAPYAYWCAPVGGGTDPGPGTDPGEPEDVPDGDDEGGGGTDVPDVGPVLDPGADPADTVAPADLLDVPDVPDVPDLPDVPDADVPNPYCTGRVCGTYGSGQSCGECPGGSYCDAAGQCKVCSYPLSANGFQDNCDGTVTDTRNSRMWQKGLYQASSFTDAKNHCDGLDVAYHSDWRLPTIDELRTLIIGCPATAGDGSCGVHAACFQVTCRDDSCKGCAYAGGAGPQGCYYDGAFEQGCFQFLSATRTPAEGAGDMRSWFVTFVDGGIGRSEQMSQSGGWVRCVR